MFCTCVTGTPTVPSVSEQDYERLFQESAPALWRALYGFAGGRRQIAEDALAEAFARVIERGDSVRDPIRMSTGPRSAWRRPSCNSTSTKACWERTASRSKRRASFDLIRALETLPAKQRAAVILHDEEGYSAAEVGDLLGIAAPTVRVHLHRGRKRLRALLGTEEDEDR